MFIFSLFLVGLGCSTTSGAKKPSDIQPPKWWSASPQSERIFSGQSSGAATSKDALRVARQQAFSKVARRIGVQVEGEVQIKQTQKSGEGYSYKIRNKTKTETVPIEIKEFDVVKQKVLKAGDWMAWIHIKVPSEEMARLGREFRRKTALLVKCTPGTYCPTGLRKKVTSIASQKGDFNFVAKRLTEKPDKLGYAKVAKKYDAAFALVVHFKVTDSTELDGEYYAIAEVEWTEYDLDEQKVRNSKVLGPVKGARFSKRDAIHNAVNKLLDELEDK